MNFGDILIYVIAYFGLFTSIFFLLTFLENKSKIALKKTNKFPKVSIIVPAYNEERTIKKTVKSLLNLNYPKEKLELIVIDDGSTDKTYEVMKQFKGIKNIRLFTKENEGKGKTLNFGLKHATGSLVGGLDADSFVSKNALINMIHYFDDKEVMAVTPSLKVYRPKRILQKIQKMEYVFGIFLRKVFSMLNSIHVTPGPFSIYRKWFFDTYGGYDENNITEDIEIALRIQSHHYKIENCLGADVYTVSPEKFNALLNQRVRWYLGFTNNTLNYKHLFGTRYGDLGMFILPAAFFSVFLVIVSLFYFAFKSGVNLYQKYLDYSSIGFDFWRMFELNFDPFFINANSVALFVLLTFIMGVLVIYMSKLAAKEKTKIRYDYALYLLAYWFLFGFWWAIAFIYKVSGKNIVWFNKKENG